MRFFAFLLVTLFSAVFAQINVCKFMKIPTPAATTGYYLCTTHAVNDRICEASGDYYELMACETKTGGAVNILTEFGTRYLLLGDAYANHYLNQQ